MRFIRSFLFLYGLSVIALAVASPQPINLRMFAISCLISAIVVIIGLNAAAPFGRGVIFVDRSWQREQILSPKLQVLPLSVFIGLVMGGLLLLILFLLTSLEPKLSARLVARLNQPVWMPWLYALEASILEEFFFRLFFMSGIIWLICRVSKRELPSAGIVWTAIGVSTLGFGLIHLPAWFSVVRPTALLVSIVMLLNGIAGIVLGTVYWKWGIEAAILCHYAGDMVVQGFGPRLLNG